MKELIYQLSQYNLWANQQLLNAILQIPEVKHTQTIASSFDSLLKTVVHMWNSESVWWQRIKLREKIIAPADGFSGSMKEAAEGLLQQNKLFDDWVAGAQEHMLQHQFIYQNSKREQFKQPVYQTLVHVFNHGAYHRGQLVTMLRQLGVEKIPQTDFVVWCRKK